MFLLSLTATCQVCALSLKAGLSTYNWLAAAKVVHVTVPGEAPGNPWLDAFGRSATDPDFPEFLEELQSLRTLDTPA